MVGPCSKKAHENRPALRVKLTKRLPKRKADQYINAQAESCKARPQEPEALAQALALGRADAARGPERGEDILQHQEEER